MTEANHLSQAENIIIQLGISALVVLVLGYVGYKVAVLLINKWANGDAKRTEATQQGFRDLIKQMHENHQHVLSVINAHQADELETINEIRTDHRVLVSRIETALELTPIRGAKRADPDQETPVDRPPVKPPRAATGSGIPKVITEYGPFQPKPSKG